jgi:hypothetical protein
MTNLNSLIIEYKKIKSLWFKALSDCDDGRMKFYQKRMGELEAKIRIYSDDLDDKEKEVVDWEIVPHEKWANFIQSLVKNGDNK